MTDMKTFRHKITGIEGLFPDTSFYRNHPQMELVEDDTPPKKRDKVGAGNKKISTLDSEDKK